MNKGIVIKSTGRWYKVQDSNNNIIDCIIRGKFRQKGIKSTNPIAVGDIVFFQYEDNQDIAVINKIEERKNYIVRKSVNLSKQSHILAANIDKAFVMITLKDPETTTEFIDRILLSAESFKIKSVLLFNKIDLLDEEDSLIMNYLIKVYSSIGYECYRINALTGENIDVVKEQMKDNISVVIGHSGTGKSTLVNKIEPTINTKVSDISEYHKSGMHTTTFAEMHKLHFGGYYIDTPGIKGFGLFDYNKEQLHYYFPEIFKESEDCKYNNCVHIHEPGCAVIQAVENNTISEIRYNNYLSIYNDDENRQRL